MLSVFDLIYSFMTLPSLIFWKKINNIRMNFYAWLMENLSIFSVKNSTSF